MSQVDKDAALNTSATAAPCSSLVFSEVSLGARHCMLKENCHKPNKDGIHPGSEVVWWVWYQCCFSISQPLATVVNVKKKILYQKQSILENCLTQKESWLEDEPESKCRNLSYTSWERVTTHWLDASRSYCDYPPVYVWLLFFYHSFLIYQWKNSNHCLS